MTGVNEHKKDIQNLQNLEKQNDNTITTHIDNCGRLSPHISLPSAE